MLLKFLFFECYFLISFPLQLIVILFHDKVWTWCWLDSEAGVGHAWLPPKKITKQMQKNTTQSIERMGMFWTRCYQHQVEKGNRICYQQILRLKMITSTIVVLPCTVSRLSSREALSSCWEPLGSILISSNSWYFPSFDISQVLIFPKSLLTILELWYYCPTLHIISIVLLFYILQLEQQFLWLHLIF